jgi:hypothetical protein
MKKAAIWFIGVVIAAIVAWFFSGLPHPFLEKCRVKNVDIRIFYSSRTAGLVTKFENEMKKCGNDIVVANHNFESETSNVRYYTEADQDDGIKIVEWLNEISGEFPMLNVRFILNSRVGEVTEDRSNRFHVYLKRDKS